MRTVASAVLLVWACASLAQNGRAAIPLSAVLGLSAIAIGAWAVADWLAHEPIRIVADVRQRTIKFENCRFCVGFWKSSRIPVVTLAFRDINRALLRGGRYSDAFSLQLETVRGRVYVGADYTNVKQLGLLLMANPDRPHCSNCGYGLRDNVSGRCPECGLKIVR